MSLHSGMDRFDRINDLLNKADEAKNQESYRMAVKYYEAVLYEEPDNWEAAMYLSIICEMNIDCEESDRAIRTVRNTLDTAANRILKHENKPEMRKYYCQDIAIMASRFAYYICDLQIEEFNNLSNSRNYYTRLSPVAFANNYMYPRYEAIADMMYSLGDRLEYEFDNGEGIEAAKQAWETGNSILKMCLNHAGLFEKHSYKSRISLYKKKIESK